MQVPFLYRFLQSDTRMNINFTLS